MAAVVNTLNTAQPMAAGRAPGGTCRPVMDWQSCFSAPWGYRVRRISTTTGARSLSIFSLSISAALALLSSMAMWTRSTPKRRARTFMPPMTSSGCSRRKRWSLVM